MDGQVQAALGTWQDVTANDFSLAAIQKAVNTIAMRMASKAYSAWQHLAGRYENIGRGCTSSDVMECCVAGQVIPSVVRVE